MERPTPLRLDDIMTRMHQLEEENAQLRELSGDNGPILYVIHYKEAYPDFVPLILQLGGDHFTEFIDIIPREESVEKVYLRFLDYLPDQVQEAMDSCIERYIKPYYRFTDSGSFSVYDLVVDFEEDISDRILQYISRDELETYVTSFIRINSQTS